MKRVIVVSLVCVAALLCSVLIPGQAEAQRSDPPLICNLGYFVFGTICKVTNPGTTAETTLAFRCPPSSEPVIETVVSFGGVSFIQECTSVATTDADGVPPLFDNCPDRWNPDQKDTDGDGIGDVCDVPDEISVIPGNRSEGTPLSYAGCPGGFVRATVQGLVLALDEVSPGMYELRLDPQMFPDGEYVVVIDADCPDGPDADVVFVAEISYLDPSGLILNQLGQPLSGATVTLFHSPNELSDPQDDGFVAVPPGSAIMSQANRVNPVVTDGAGFYKWDTVAGWYVVSASVPGCMNPDGSGPEVRSAVLPVPPPQFNVDLTFNCALPLCNGQTPTLAATAGVPLVGTPGDDVILGSSGDDVIDAGAGNDTVCAGAGNDTVVGGDGDDTVLGEAGRDILRGGPGVDEVHGGDGNDRVLGGIGNDNMSGGEGNDYLGGFGGADTIDGGPGNERIFGGFGADIITGGPGDDVISGLIGNDTINGGPGNDTLNGDRGNDTINGDDGDDTINGGNANDILNGGAGDDSVNGGRADDTLSGGADEDTCVGNKEIVADTADATCEVIFGIP